MADAENKRRDLGTESVYAGLEVDSKDSVDDARLACFNGVATKVQERVQGGSSGTFFGSYGVHNFPDADDFCPSVVEAVIKRGEQGYLYQGIANGFRLDTGRDISGQQVFEITFNSGAAGNNTYNVGEKSIPVTCPAAFDAAAIAGYDHPEINLGIDNATLDRMISKCFAGDGSENPRTGFEAGIVFGQKVREHVDHGAPSPGKLLREDRMSALDR